jgi:uncharacterized membrane protein
VLACYNLPDAILGIVCSISVRWPVCYCVSVVVIAAVVLVAHLNIDNNMHKHINTHMRRATVCKGTVNTALLLLLLLLLLVVMLQSMLLQMLLIRQSHSNNSSMGP